MDKLEPIIKHRFWILLGLVAPLAIYAYYSGNGGLKAATEAREGELNNLSPPTGNEPNPRWSDGAKEINEDYAVEVNREIVRLYEDQFDRMVWPDNMQNYLPRDEQGHPIYRAELPDEAGFTYRAEYIDVMRDVYMSVQPLVRDQRGKLAPGGKVVVDESIIPLHTFGALSISSKEIWDAQEDAWLLQLLFDAVNEVNRDAENAAKSSVRQILKVELRGGNGQSIASATGTTGTTSGLSLNYEEQMSEAMGESYEEAGDGGYEDFMGGGRSNAKIAFDPAEEFGSDADTAAQATTTTTTSLQQENELSMDTYSLGASNGPKLRYIAHDETAPYRERGFYLSVLVKQQKFPDFLVALTNSDWPIRIVRFHVGANPNSTGNRPSGGGGYPMAGGGMFGNEYGGGGPGYNYEEAGESVDQFAYGGEGYGGYGSPGYGTMSSDEEKTLLTQSDLVQLDVCGVITFYNPPSEDVLAAVAAAAGDAMAATDASPAPEAGAESADDASSPSATSDPAATETTTEPIAPQTEPTEPTEPENVDAGGEPGETAADAPASEPTGEPN